MGNIDSMKEHFDGEICCAQRRVDGFHSSCLSYRRIYRNDRHIITFSPHVNSVFASRIYISHGNISFKQSGIILFRAVIFKQYRLIKCSSSA